MTLGADANPLTGVAGMLPDGIAPIQGLQIPINRCSQSLSEIMPGMPAQFLGDTPRVDGIATVMPRAVAHPSDQAGMGCSLGAPLIQQRPLQRSPDAMVPAPSPAMQHIDRDY